VALAGLVVHPRAVQEALRRRVLVPEVRAVLAVPVDAALVGLRPNR
jgi:hypothetical protein